MGLALNACGLFWFASLNEKSSYTSILVSLMLFGFGRAMFTSPNSSSVMGSVPPEKRGVAMVSGAFEPNWERAQCAALIAPDVARDAL